MNVTTSAAAMTLAALLVGLTAHVSVAQDKKGPLADLPSKPGAHVEKIKALGDNEWLNLGAPAADPKWGKARGSSWGAKALILAPDKRGAFLFGEGVHGYVKPDGHGMDDLWFYDLNAHAWTCLHPGTDTKTFTQRVKDKELVIDNDGQLIDTDKQPVPVHTLVHAWGYLAYDSDRKKFAFLSWNGTAGGPVPRYFLGGEKQMDEGLKLLDGQLKDKKKRVFSPWFYDVASGKFERSPATNSTAISAGGFPSSTTSRRRSSSSPWGPTPWRFTTRRRTSGPTSSRKAQVPRATTPAAATTPSGTASTATTETAPRGKDSWRMTSGPTPGAT